MEISTNSIKAQLNQHRRDLLKNHRDSVIERRRKHEKEKLKSFKDLRQLIKNTVTIDTSTAGIDLPLVRMCAREFGWIEYPHWKPDKKCDITWSNRCIDGRDMGASLHNKFPGMSTILGKANLSWCLGLLHKLYPEDYSFFPQTWILPYHYAKFVHYVNEQERKHRKIHSTFIVKPDDGSQGDGIYLLKDPADCALISSRLHIVQEYIDKPLLIDGYKFDLRIYVTIVNIDPLEIYICREGLVRFCTVPYQTPTAKNLRNTYMHLTNYSLNKKSDTFLASDKDNEGSKQTLTSVFRVLERPGYDVVGLWTSIKNLVCKTMFAVEPQMLTVINELISAGRPPLRCFQVLGFDILLRSDLSPILLEVNSNPSLRIDHEQQTLPGITEYVPSRTDRIVKAPMLRDTLLMVAPRAKMTNYLKRKTKRQQDKKKWAASKLSINSDSENMDNIETTEKCSNENTLHETNDDNLDQQGENTLLDFDSALDNHNQTQDENEELQTPFMLPNTSLQKIYPTLQLSHFERFRIFRRICDIFRGCLGVRANVRLGPTAFRAFTRKCAIAQQGLSNADIDILYINIQRKWDYLNLDRSTGLCYQAFIEAFFEIAKRKFYSKDPREMIENLVDFCETNINIPPAPRKSPKLLRRRKIILNSSLYQSELRLSKCESMYRPRTRDLTNLSFSFQYNS